MAKSGIEQQVIIRLRAHDESSVEWVLRSRSGEILTEPQVNSLEELSTEVLGRELIVLIPTECVTLLTANLPHMRPAKLRQAVPYALEDTLASPVENLHFCLYSGKKNHGVDVAVVDKKWLENWVSRFQAVGLFPDVMIPEVCALPYQENIWHVYVNAHYSVCRTGFCRGFEADNTNLLFLLDLKLKEGDHPEKIILDSFNASLKDELQFSNLPVPVEFIKHASEQYFLNIASQVQKDNPINLLQGEFRVEKKASALKKWWLLSLGLFFTWLIVVFGGLLFHRHNLSSQNASLEQAIAKIYQRNFPKAQGVVAPKFRMEEKLKGLQGDVGVNLYLRILAKAGDIIHQNKSIKLAGLTFKDKSLAFDVVAPDFDHLHNLLTALQKQGLNTKQRNASSEGDVVKATMVITGD